MKIDKQKNSCKNKVRYESLDAANFFAMSDGLRSYPCPVCKGFHLTSNKVDKGRESWKEFK